MFITVQDTWTKFWVKGKDFNLQTTIRSDAVKSVLGIIDRFPNVFIKICIFMNHRQKY